VRIISWGTDLLLIHASTTSKAGALSNVGDILVSQEKRTKMPASIAIVFNVFFMPSEFEIVRD
jgi:hypothetical protein